jgi:phospholipid/cholesterol/gamma-HCH transport system substrate-binding protein
MSTPFRERNPVIIGAVSLAVMAAFILAAFKADSLPLIGGGDTYYAAFSEAGGLKANDEVRVAGVRVGKIKAVELEGDHVRVEFKVDKSAKFGPDTGAAIKVKTLLGAMFLALEPSGRGQMKENAEIPTSRTTSPYDVVQAFSGLASRSKKINTQRLARSLNTLGDLTKTTPRSFRAALSGLSDLSSNVAKRDKQLNSLLRHTKKVSTVLGDRSGDLTTLMRNGDVLFRALAARRDSIHRLLVATSQLSIQLTGLVQDTRADLKPALDHLGRVVDVLNKNQNNLDNSLRLMAPFYKVFANTLSNGPWFDTYIQNLPPVGAPDLGQVG